MKAPEGVRNFSRQSSESVFGRAIEATTSGAQSIISTLIVHQSNLHAIRDRLAVELFPKKRLQEGNFRFLSLG